MHVDPQGKGSWRLTRRSFVQGGLSALALLTLPCPARAFLTPGVKQGYLNLRPALFCQALPNKQVKCLLCPRGCEVADGDRGDCGVRENRGGKYYTLVYGNPCAVHVDPVEKKPLFHVLPGSFSYSIATAGCNIECKFCQNWQISQFRPEQVESVLVEPERLVRACKARGSPTIAYTYSEPVIFYEYMHDSAALGRAQGIGSVMISNGYIQEKPLRQLCRQLTGVKIEVDKLGIDICVTSSQKALGLPPGLSLASVSEKAKKRAGEIGNRGYYFDMLQLLEYVEERNFQYPSTPSISHTYALDFALERILNQEGLEARFERHRQRRFGVLVLLGERFRPESFSG